MPGAFLNVRRTARRAKGRMPGVIHPQGVKFMVISLMKDIIDGRLVKIANIGKSRKIPTDLEP